MTACMPCSWRVLDRCSHSRTVAVCGASTAYWSRCFCWRTDLSFSARRRSFRTMQIVAQPTIGQQRLDRMYSTVRRSTVGRNVASSRKIPHLSCDTQDLLSEPTLRSAARAMLALFFTLCYGWRKMYMHLAFLCSRPSDGRAIPSANTVCAITSTSVIASRFAPATRM
jgi:hypothetical protein